MSDTGNEAEERDWFARQEALQDRLAALMRRIRDPDGSSLETITAELESAEREMWQGLETRPTPEEIERKRLALEREEGRPVSRQDVVRRSLQRAMTIFKELQKPAPHDVSVAILKNDLEGVRRLLDAGVDPNALTTTGDSLLKQALRLRRFEIAALLRDYGATYGLMEAAITGDVPMLTALLDEGEDVNRKGANGERALHLAVRKGHRDAVRLLLERGAWADIRDHRNQTPLESACIEGFPEVAELLVHIGKVPVGVVEAAYLGDIPLLTRLLDEGADIETRSPSQRTALHAAARCGHVECVAFLLRRGANPRDENGFGLTPLIAAIFGESVPIIHLLLDTGIDINAPSGKENIRWTPLQYAVMQGDLRVIQTLLKRGADPNLSAEKGRTPLHVCALPALFSREGPGQSARIAALLLDAGADIEERDAIDHTTLMNAASNGDAPLVRLLLERGANVRASDPTGRATPLLCARQPSIGDHIDKTETLTLIMEALGSEYALYDAAERGDAVRVADLLDSGVPADACIALSPPFPNIRYPDRSGNAPLLVAASRGHTAVVRLLLARPEIDAESKRKALDLADFHKREEVARLLREEWVSAG